MNDDLKSLIPSLHFHPQKLQMFRRITQYNNKQICIFPQPMWNERFDPENMSPRRDIRVVVSFGIHL